MTARHILPALASAISVASGCSPHPAEPALPENTDPTIGPSTLRTHCAALYVTPQNRVTDEHFGTTDAGATIEYSGFTSTGRFTGSSNAHATFGILRTHAAADAGNATFRSNSAVAEAAFDEAFRIDSPSHHGPVRVVFTFDVQTTATGLKLGGGHSHDAPDASSHLFLRRQGVADMEIGGDPIKAGTVVSDPLSVTIGEPFSAGLLLSSVASVPMNYTASVAVDATATLARIAVLDPSGNEIPDAVVHSAGGSAPGPSRPARH